ncbi:MAG TPA: hypothetical protein VKP11_05255 [Frankiaceae bacterium]|nr:hypothetical protein [Frankiaceae bacterium]
MNGYLVFEHLDKTADDRLLELVGPAGPLRAAAVGVTGTPSAVAAYDAETIKDAQDRVAGCAAAGCRRWPAWPTSATGSPGRPGGGRRSTPDGPSRCGCSAWWCAPATPSP